MTTRYNHTTKNGLISWSFKPLFVTTDFEKIKEFINAPTFHSNWIGLTLVDGDTLLLGGEVYIDKKESFPCLIDHVYVKNLIVESMLEELGNGYDFVSTRSMWLTGLSLKKSSLPFGKELIDKVLSESLDHDNPQLLNEVLFDGCYISKDDDYDCTLLVDEDDSERELKLSMVLPKFLVNYFPGEYEAKTHFMEHFLTYVKENHSIVLNDT